MSKIESVRVEINTVVPDDRKLRDSASLCRILARELRNQGLSPWDETFEALGDDFAAIPVDHADSNVRASEYQRHAEAAARLLKQAVGAGFDLFPNRLKNWSFPKHDPMNRNRKLWAFAWGTLLHIVGEWGEGVPSQVDMSVTAEILNGLTVTEAAQLFVDMKVIKGLTLEKAKARIAKAYTDQPPRIKSLGVGRDRRIDRRSLVEFIEAQDK